MLERPVNIIERSAAAKKTFAPRRRLLVVLIFMFSKVGNVPSHGAEALPVCYAVVAPLAG